MINRESQSFIHLLMFPLRVVVSFLSFLVHTDAQSKYVVCAIRPPPDMHVVPFKRQRPYDYFKKCVASNHTCYYFRYHGTQVSRDFPVHGCAPYTKLPPACQGGATFYDPNWMLSFRGAEYKGSIKCCGNDYCNEIEEAMFVPVHMNHDDARFFKTYLLFPLLLTFFMALVFKEYLPDFTYELRRLLHLEKGVEMGRQEGTLLMNPCNLDIIPEKANPQLHQQPYTGPNVTGFFSSISNMLEVIREMEKWQPELEARREKEMKKEERKGRAKRRHGKETYTKPVSINQNISNRQASEHVDSKVFREVPSRLSDLLSRLIEHGPYEFPFDPNELGDLFEKASVVLAEEPSVVEIDLGVNIIGNLEGSYVDLFRWFGIFGWPPKEKFVFLGGAIAPENPFSLEVLALLLALKLKMPSRVYLIRGCAEGMPLNMGDRFPPRVSETLREVAAKALTRLPLAVLINKQILCIHSSLPTWLDTVEEINQVRRPLVEYHRDSLEAHLFNAIPDDVLHRPMDLTNGENAIAYVDEIIDGFLKKGSLMFLPKDLDDTAKKLKIDLIIRAKSVCEYGFSALSNCVMSLWSAQALAGVSAGAAILIDTNANIGFTRLFHYGTFNQDKTEVAQHVLENTVSEELEEMAKKGMDDLDGIHLKEPVKSQMCYQI